MPEPAYFLPEYIIQLEHQPRKVPLRGPLADCGTVSCHTQSEEALAEQSREVLALIAAELQVRVAATCEY